MRLHRLRHSTTKLSAGRIAGFDFARDPLDAKRPMQTVRGDHEEGHRSQAERRWQAQRKLLESRYDLSPKLDPDGQDVARQAAARRADGPAGRRA